MEAARNHECGLLQSEGHNKKRPRLITEHSPRGGEEEEEDKGKKKNIIYFSDSRSSKWEELPEDLLNLIFDRLNLEDYVIFGYSCWIYGAVCRTWRSLYVERKQASLITSHPPLLFMVAQVGKKKKRAAAAYFLNIYDYGTMRLVPYACNMYRNTFCCGYLISYVHDFRQLQLLNPITRNIYRFPYPKASLDRVTIASSSLVRRPWPYSRDNLVIVGVNMSQEYVHFYRSKDAKWGYKTYGTKPGEIVDIVNFKGKIYFLTESAGIGTINLNEDEQVLVRLEVNKGLNPPPSASKNGHFLELVVSDDRLMMLAFLERKVVSIYEFDFSKMEWARVEERLGDDEAIFAGNLNTLTKSSALVKNISRWGGQSNCIYLFDCNGNCFVYSLAGEKLETRPSRNDFRWSHKSFPVWYFPHQCNIYGTIDSLYED